jgi:hypothetical protein
MISFMYPAYDTASALSIHYRSLRRIHRKLRLLVRGSGTASLRHRIFYEVFVRTYPCITASASASVALASFSRMIFSNPARVSRIRIALL